MNARELIDRGLDGFSVRQMVEVFDADEHGMRAKTTPIGLFESLRVAKAFISSKGGNYYGTCEVIVLVSEKEGFVLEKSAPVFNTESVMSEARKRALSKLSPDERAILGYSDTQTE